MDLWTEFEGVTIDSSYSLKRLLQTEGRSAFFSTQNAAGDPVLIRIIECHFDEDEILARWRGVETLGNPAFLRIDRFGQFLIEEDQITAVYAVFERVDENLAHVLERGRLSIADATQIGRSVASALETLHANGFVHQHVEARNIYAVGETVKMRSDCIRETPEGEVGLEARRRDIYDFAVLLMQVLRGMGAAASGRAPLPEPFDEIVRHGMDGSWGLAEIQRALAPAPADKKQARKLAIAAPAPLPAAAPAMHNPPANAPKPAVAAASSANPPETRANQAHAPAPETPFLLRRTPMEELPVIFGISQEDMRRYLTIAGGVLAAVLLIAYMVHRWTAPHTQPPAAPPETASTQRPQVAEQQESPAAPATTPDTSSTGLQWRVVVFTFNHKDQAEKKMMTLAHKYPALWPNVFSPSGRSPWLVTIGGALERDGAYALARKARGLGLPHDTYAQNYSAPK